MRWTTSGAIDILGATPGMHDDATKPLAGSGELLAGKYRVERLLGEGGMGVVLAARHEQLNTNVAIKLLRGAAVNQGEVLGRFLREARAASSLRSEHVARVLDVGTLEDGRPYIVMERLEGVDLGEVCEAATLPDVSEAVDYVMQACEAIAEAHAAGIIHRDLKPKNLFLTRTVHGRPLVKVLDFGISKVDAAGELELTKTADVIGSPSYMSPEQLRSARHVDTRTDIWALGVILYELLTGRLPFNAETMTELVLVVVTEPHPSIRGLRPDVPPGLEAVVDRCLAKKPDDRFQSIVELVSALEPFAHLVQTSASDRIRAVAHSGRPTPGGNISGTSTGPALPLVTPSSRPSGGSGSLKPASSGRVHVHGGTSVAWGETESMVHAAPVVTAPPPMLPPRQSSSMLALGIGALVGVVIVGGAVALLVGRSSQAATAPSAHPVATQPKDEAIPLPDGRKDLPPSTAPLPPASDVPTPSTLPADRKPGPIPLPKPAAKPTAPSPTPAPKPKDDLEGIGRH